MDSVNVLIKELSSRSIYLYTSLGVNFAIQILWVIITSARRTSTDYRTAQEAKAEGGMDIFISTQLILYLFSFIVTLAVFLSLDFMFSVKEVLGIKYIWWLPSAVSIGLAETAKLLAKIFRSKEEREALDASDLEERSRRLSYYFVVSALALVSLWFYIVFGEDSNSFYSILEGINKLLL